MIDTTWTVGGDPLPIINAKCGLTRSASDCPDLANLIFVDIRLLEGTVSFDADGYLPHLAYTPDYAKTERDHGPFTVTGNVAEEPVWRFDPAPFYADMSGSLVLTGGSGTAVFAVSVAIKRCAKWKPLRHTLTMAMRPGGAIVPIRRPYAAIGLWMPDAMSTVSLAAGSFSRVITAPNGGFVALGMFDLVSVVPTTSLVTFEIALPS